MDTPGEGDSPSDQQSSQQLDLSHGVMTSNGWQVIPVSVGVSTGGTTVSTDSLANSLKNRQTISSVGLQGQQQYVVTQAPTLQGQQVLTTLSSVMPNIQYQVIPQFQTVDGQQLQFTQQAQQDTAVGVGQQFQLVSSPNGQQLIATTNRAGSTGNILTVPGLLQGAIPIQNLGLSGGLLQNQPQFLANMPMSLNGNITLLPVSTGDGGSGGDTGINQLLQQQPVSSNSSTGYLSGTTTVTTQTATSYGQVQSSNGVATASFQQNVQADSREGQQQPQQILIQANTLNAAGGQVFTTPTLSQEGLQNVQIMPNTGPILLRTVGPNGQVSWQTIQLQSPMGGQITLAPVQSLPQAQGGTVNTVQIPGLQTINLNTLGGSGLQMHQLQGLPIAMANTAGQRARLCLAEALATASFPWSNESKLSYTN